MNMERPKPLGYSSKLLNTAASKDDPTAEFPHDICYPSSGHIVQEPGIFSRMGRVAPIPHGYRTFTIGLAKRQ